MRVVFGSRARGVAASVVLALLAAGAAGGAADDPLAAARERMRARDKWTRAEAVDELARFGTEEAWELVLAALADPAGEVADGAQLVLAALSAPKVREALAGEAGLRAREPLVRARVAELLGRLPEAAPRPWFERALRDEAAEVRRMAAWSLERLARRGALPEEVRAELGEDLARMARSERDPPTRARCLAALCVLAPAAAPAALEAARREREPWIRGAAAALAPEVLEGAAAVSALAPLAGDPSPNVRRVALEALARAGSREAAMLLVERLAAEDEERALMRVVELLQGLSGLKHRRDPRPWKDWLAELPPDWKAPRSPQRFPGPSPAPVEEAEERSRVALAGLPIVSKRVTILIDLSGSIWTVRADGRTRKQVVDAKLREALEALPPDTRINLIPYTREPHPWKDELVPATPARVREAARWFEERKESGSGNFWDAAMLALADPEVDTLLVLFDGAPTGGTRHRLELIAPLFLELDFARGVALDLVLVDASKRLQRAWGDLAAATGGRVVCVSL